DALPISERSAAGVPAPSRSAMRLLHRRHTDVDDAISRRASAANRARCARDALRPHLPLHGVRWHRRGHPRHRASTRESAANHAREGGMSYPEELDGLRYEKDVAGKTGYVIFDRPPMNVI